MKPVSELNRKDYVSCLGLLRYYVQTNPRAQNQPNLDRYGEIFSLWLEGEKSYSKIGKEYGIGKERVRQIIHATAEILRSVFDSCRTRFELGD